MPEYVIKRYDGDDIYSYAIFRKRDVRRLARTIFYGEANPVICGLSKEEAKGQKKLLEMEIRYK